MPRYEVEVETIGRALFEMDWDGPEPPTKDDAQDFLRDNDVEDNQVEWSYGQVQDVKECG